MKGGVIKRNPEADDFETLFNFIANSECEILTDISLACITYKFTRRDKDIESPYISCRSTNLKQNVNSILLKVFLSGIIKDIYKNRSRGFSMVPVTHIEALKNEVYIQEFVYKKSYISQISTCEPICPSIIIFSDTLDEETEDILFDYIIKNITNRISKGSEIDDKNITSDWFNKNKNFGQSGIKIIAMELMDGYITLHKYLYDNKENPEKQIKALQKCMWQFVNLSKIVGVSHHDCNFGNIMINEDNQYFNEVDRGQPIIIDFGRAEKLNQDLSIKEDKSLETMRSIVTIEEYIIELNNHKYYDFGTWVVDLKFKHKYPEITLLDYWNYEITKMYGLDIANILDINYLNNLTKMRIKMTQKFNDALIAEYKTDFNGIITDFIMKLEQEKQPSKSQKRKAETDENSKRGKMSKMEKMGGKIDENVQNVLNGNMGVNYENGGNEENVEMTWEDIFAGATSPKKKIPTGGGNKIIRYDNIYKNVLKNISLKEFKNLISEEITIRPIEKIFTKTHNQLTTYSQNLSTYNHQLLQPPIKVYGGTRKYKFKKHKSQINNKNIANKSKKTYLKLKTYKSKTKKHKKQ